MMLHDPLEKIDKKIRAFQRGILTAEELVDGALGELAYEGRYDLVGPTVERLLREVPEAAVVGWVAWDERQPTSPYRLMIHADSRAVYNHCRESRPGVWEDLETEAGQARVEAHREELRGNVRRVADIVRAVLDESHQAADEIGEPE